MVGILYYCTLTVQCPRVSQYLFADVIHLLLLTRKLTLPLNLKSLSSLLNVFVVSRGFWVVLLGKRERERNRIHGCLYSCCCSICLQLDEYLVYELHLKLIRFLSKHFQSIHLLSPIHHFRIPSRNFLKLIRLCSYQVM